jgi:hypothetical protein
MAGAIYMNREAELYCRDELRRARSAVLKDSEAFAEIIFAIERTGAVAYGQPGTMQSFLPVLRSVAERSPLAKDCPYIAPEYHMSFAALYELVRSARNEALHVGTFARHLTSHTVELALILEDGLVNGSDRVSDYMVKGPLCAERWQPLSLVRQQMLANAFSFLPLRSGSGQGEWLLVSDLSLARYLSDGQRSRDRHRRLAHTIAEAEHQGLLLTRALTVPPDASVTDVLKEAGSTPALVVSPDGHLLGIVTPFDLL